MPVSATGRDGAARGVAHGAANRTTDGSGEQIPKLDALRRREASEWRQRLADATPDLVLDAYPLGGNGDALDPPVTGGRAGVR